MTTHELPRFADITTMHVGGPIADLHRPHTHEEFVGLLQKLHTDGQPFLVLGGGSNVVASDEPYEGTVIVTQSDIDPRIAHDDTGFVRVVAEAGYEWDKLVAFCVDHQLAGLEALSGIPGAVGGAPIQNIGAYGAEVAQVIDRIEVFDRKTGSLSWCPYHAFEPTYRHTLLKAHPLRFVVTRISVRLQEQAHSYPIAYAQLANHLNVRVGDVAQLSSVRSAVLELRRTKGMVYDKTDHDTWSCGSFFTNPIVSSEVASQIPESIPRYPQKDNAYVKLSAAALIEHAGCGKGAGISGSNQSATLSHKHVLAITNRGEATAQDIVDLAYHVQHCVQKTFDITLVSEPVGIGLSLPQ